MVCATRRWLFCLLVFVLAGGWLIPAVAKSSSLKNDEPIEVSANILRYEQQGRRLLATGKVEARRSDGVELFADQLIYDQDSRRIIAEGNVFFQDKSGQATTTDRLEITDDLKDGLIGALEARFVDKSRLRAVRGKRVEGNKSILEDASYTACETCPGDTKTPIWELHAGTVTHDQAAQRIFYDDLMLDVYGVPVFYAPYFSHSDPTVKRQSGFLMPKLSQRTEQGAILGAPYYWAIDEQQQAIIEPRFFTSAGVMGLVDYERQFGNGTVAANLSAANVKELISGSQTDRTVQQGHYAARGNFDINDAWRWNFSAARVSDASYFRRFQLPYGGGASLTRNLTAERFGRDSYFNASGYNFQTLRQGDNQRAVPVVLPWLRYSDLKSLNGFPGKFSLDTSTVALTRLNGQDTRRISGAAGWQNEKRLPLSTLFTYGALLRSDYYWYGETQLTTDPTNPKSGDAGRAEPIAYAKISQPWIRQAQSGMTHLIEPIAGVVVARNPGKQDKIPNEDFKSFEFDDNNLFEADRIYARDRFDGGQRVDVGVNNIFENFYGARMGAFAGQSFRRQDSDLFAAGSGLNGTRSDYVGRVALSYAPFFDFENHARLNKDNGRIQRNDANLTLNWASFQMSNDYVFFGKQTSSNEKDIEQFSTMLSTFVKERWLVSGKYTRDIAAPANRLASGGITYFDNCFSIGLDVTRDFTDDGTVAPSTSVMLRLDFRTLGNNAWYDNFYSRDRLRNRRYTPYEQESLGLAKP
ncbi:MAG: LPS-assembly protein LptD [Holosporales bacterium]